ncbi:hypothetical protein [Kitasatospora griseola]|uniref:hypothetical protein n=1 Tax=Kitasatospora griseola TaxID=2064 RepID=UPI003663F480
MTTTDPLTGRTPREELYRAIITGGTLIRQPGQDHTQAANARLDAYREQVLAEAAARVLGLQVREPLDDVDHRVNDMLARAARTVQEG